MKLVCAKLVLSKNNLYYYILSIIFCKRETKDMGRFFVPKWKLSYTEIFYFSKIWVAIHRRKFCKKRLYTLLFFQEMLLFLYEIPAVSRFFPTDPSLSQKHFSQNFDPRWLVVVLPGLLSENFYRGNWKNENKIYTLSDQESTEIVRSTSFSTWDVFQHH